MADLEYAQDDGNVGFGGEEVAENGNGHDAELCDNTEVNTDDRKIFVGGLAWDLVETELKDHFCKYGEVEIVDLKKDLTTGKNRGFCFITFKEAASVDKVLKVKNHSIGLKTIDCKKAKSRVGKEPKVFVGGVEPTMTKEQISEHFQQFGEVKDVIWPKNKYTDAKQTFVFIMFDKLEHAKKAINHESHMIGEKEVDVKEATPAPDPNRRGRGRGGFRGDFRGGRGRGGPPGRGRGGGGGYYNQGGYGGGYDQYNQGYYGGYDYNQQQYPGYDYSQGYDYSNYGNQGYGYDQSGYYAGYDQSAYGYGNYNYDQWNNYYNQQGGAPAPQQQPGNYGKAPRRGGNTQTDGSAVTSQYHPYSRQ